MTTNPMADWFDSQYKRIKESRSENDLRQMNYYIVKSFDNKRITYDMMKVLTSLIQERLENIATIECKICGSKEHKSSVCPNYI